VLARFVLVVLRHINHAVVVGIRVGIMEDAGFVVRAYCDVEVLRSRNGNEAAHVVQRIDNRAVVEVAGDQPGALGVREGVALAAARQRPHTRPFIARCAARACIPAADGRFGERPSLRNGELAVSDAVLDIPVACMDRGTGRGNVNAVGFLGVLRGAVGVTRSGNERLDAVENKVLILYVVALRKN